MRGLWRVGAIGGVMLACGSSGGGGSNDAGLPSSDGTPTTDAGGTDVAGWTDTTGRTDAAPPEDAALPPDATPDASEPVVNDFPDVTPDDGQNDTPAIQARLAAAAAGDILTLGTGTYDLGSPVALPPGIVLKGAADGGTTLRLQAGSFPGFAFGYLVIPQAQPTGTTPATGISRLHLDGNRSSGAYADNQGGGVKAGSYWTIRDVTFSNFNYFRLWLKDTIGVTVHGCTWDDLPGATASENDSIGGGHNIDLRIENATLTARTTGNALDLLNSVRLTVRRLHAARGSMYLEGAVDSTVADSVLDAGGLVLQTDVGYQSSMRVVNPLGNTIQGNTVSGADTIGIAVRYDDDQGKGTPVDVGGENHIEGNTVVGAGSLGIAVFGAADAVKGSPDIIVGNQIRNVLSPAPYEYDVGYGTFDDAGIALSIGDGDEIGNNRIEDTQTPPTTRHGVVVGARGGRSVPVRTNVHDNVEVGLLAP